MTSLRRILGRPCEVFCALSIQGFGRRLGVPCAYLASPAEIPLWVSCGNETTSNNWQGGSFGGLSLKFWHGTLGGDFIRRAAERSGHQSEPLFPSLENWTTEQGYTVIMDFLVFVCVPQSAMRRVYRITDSCALAQPRSTWNIPPP